MAHMVILHRDRRGIKGIGLNDIRTHLQIFPVYLADQIGTGKRQQVVVTFEQPVKILEPLSPKIGLAQTITLYHRTHRTIQNQDATR